MVMDAALSHIWHARVLSHVVTGALVVSLILAAGCGDGSDSAIDNGAGDGQSTGGANGGNSGGVDGGGANVGKPDDHFSRTDGAEIFALPFPNDFQKFRWIVANDDGVFVAVEGNRETEGTWFVSHDVLESHDEAMITSSWTRTTGKVVSNTFVRDGRLHAFSRGGIIALDDEQTWSDVIATNTELDRPIVRTYATRGNHAYATINVRDVDERWLISDRSGAIEVIENLPADNIQAVGATADALFLGTTTGMLWTSTDGETWTRVELPFRDNVFRTYQGESDGQEEGWRAASVERIESSESGLLRVQVSGGTFAQQEDGSWIRWAFPTRANHLRSQHYDAANDQYIDSPRGGGRTYRQQQLRQWLLNSGESWSQRVGERDTGDTAVGYWQFESGDERVYVGFEKGPEGATKLYMMALNQGVVPSTDLNHWLSFASYVGTGGEDALTGIAQRQDGRLIVAGTLSDVAALGVDVDAPLGMGTGAIIWLDADQRPERVTALPAGVDDAAFGNGVLSVVGRFGLAAFDLETGTLRWDVQEEVNRRSKTRVDVGSSGRTAWMVGARVRIFSDAGELIGERDDWTRPPCYSDDAPEVNYCRSSSNGAQMQDVVIDDVHNQIIVAGHRSDGLRWDLPASVTT